MQHYSKLAELFTYPDDDLLEKVSEVNQIIEENYPNCKVCSTAFTVYLSTKTLEEQQEYYINTFDINAQCYIDIGYILFGEDYKRGEFLVNLSKEHKKAGNDCGSELADHLPNLLRLLPKIEDKKFAEELAFCMIIPALKEMIKSFKDESNIYRKTLDALLFIMEKDFHDLDYVQFQIIPKDKSCFVGKGSKNKHMCSK